MANGEEKGSRLHQWFARIAQSASVAAGHPVTFITAVAILVVWIVLGPWFHFSDTWQLTVNTLSSVVTFLMVFVLQNSQNRDTKAIHLKLDEVIRALNAAQNEMIDIEKLTDPELEALADRYARIKEEWEQRRAGVDRQHPAA